MMLKIAVETCLNALLLQEDTDGDKKITIEDKGPKSFKIKSVDGHTYTVKGTYHLSNLLQELVIAKRNAKTIAKIRLSKIEEPPADRISRMIKEHYWDGLTRCIDAAGIEKLVHDTKNEHLASAVLRIYVPYGDTVALTYYKKLEGKYPIITMLLPKVITPAYVKKLNDVPGILALKMESEGESIKALPFVVPGGRFNEMYGWDSYFESIGLLIDGKVMLAKAMADHFQYEIQHYGKILNANRSYYLTRTQPPFYTSLIREVFEHIQDKAWLASHLQTAIYEYEKVWMVHGARLTENGLNRYLAEGIGIPPETETGHYDAIIQPHADLAGISVTEYIKQYTDGKLQNKTLDDYYIHDRSVRESGHDTSYRLEGKCAHLNTVALNALLYKYETDFAAIIQSQFDGYFTSQYQSYSTDYWIKKAEYRKKQVNQYLWNDEKGLYFDYDIIKEEQNDFVSATTFIPLWAKLCSEKQAKRLAEVGLSLLKEKGGIAGCTEKSRGIIGPKRPQRQWDYPNGWAPHQIMLWKGLLNYGFHKEARECIYRWLFMITRNAVDYNGTIPEKYDVVNATHKVFAEYGNVGTDFEYITQEGFGWMNASYQYGLSLLDKTDIHRLNVLCPPEDIFQKI